ncbi:phage major capsid protein [Lactobacillus sp. ESL0677]|uniref:phage major capsid protein n=1 Tax=Lactobacillus sp. ESL0677 TaxID=2983208 RepID=UPI0023F964C3|nr:phage major capsid protein [Lactobacillus sp. ESL0677]WEV36220.1 phage major capsid protein [Lactobacillus sp. ESL0677]
MKTRQELEAAYKEASDKCADLHAKMQNLLFDDKTDKDKYKELADALDDAKFKRDELRDAIADMDEESPKDEKPTQVTPIQTFMPLKDSPTDKEKKLDVAKKKINAFVHGTGFKDDETGVTTTVVEPTVPTEIIYNPNAEVSSVVDLSTLVTKTPVTTGKGSYPILKRATDYFPSTEELKDNPKLANPDFTDVDWSVDTHRGAIAISEEAIADSQVDVTAMIGQNIREKQVNTYNRDISTLLKGFTEKDTTSATLVDDIKHILNVDLDPAYSPVLVASQSLYNALDTLKDNQGQYIFHQNISDKSGGTLLGIPVYKVNDDLLGANGEANAFIGDLARAILFVDRQNVTLNWEDSKVYGKYIGAALRYGVSKADEKAGFYLKCALAAPSSESTKASK